MTPLELFSIISASIGIILAIISIVLNENEGAIKKLILSFSCITIISFLLTLVFAFLIREDKHLLSVFKEYNLQLTKFPLEYRGVDKTRWSNYGIYTNFEQGKFKYSYKKKNK